VGGAVSAYFEDDTWCWSVIEAPEIVSIVRGYNAVACTNVPRCTGLGAGWCVVYSFEGVVDACVIRGMYIEVLISETFECPFECV
jgi:hypothetical protein